MLLHSGDGVLRAPRVLYVTSRLFDLRSCLLGSRSTDFDSTDATDGLTGSLPIFFKKHLGFSPSFATEISSLYVYVRRVRCVKVRKLTTPPPPPPPPPFADSP